MTKTITFLLHVDDEKNLEIIQKKFGVKNHADCARLGLAIAARVSE